MLFLPIPDIPQSEVHAALRGEAISIPQVVEVPPGVGDPWRVPPPPGPGKTLYGTPWANHVDSANFTVNWSAGGPTLSDAEVASDALEVAWAAYVDDQGWRLPVSSDVYLLWVILDPTLSGTGLTTVYFSGEYPDGYPVIYLNPTWTTDEAFFRSLCAHELHHAVQYAYRSWEAVDAESWYWEASAEWATESAVPDLDTYAWSAAWYMEHPEYRFDASADYHAYGMMLFNAWMEERLTGAGGMQAVWDAGSASPDATWDTVLASATATGVDVLWGGFTGSVANGLLAESDLYGSVDTTGALEDGVSGVVPYLGTLYFRVWEDLQVSTDDGVVLSGPEGWGTDIVAGPGDRVGVTGLDPISSAFTLSVVGAADTGGDPDDWGASGGKGGCNTGGGAPTDLLGLLGLLGCRGRRRRRVAS